MTIKEFAGDWDKDAYAASLRSMLEPELRQLHYETRQKVMAADATTGAGLGTAFFAPVALFGAAAGYRRRRYNQQKLDMIEQYMNSQDFERSELRKRDVFKAMGPTAVVSVVMPGAGAALGHLTGHVASHVVAHGASHVVAHGTSHAVAHGTSHAASHGASHATAHSVAHTAHAAIQQKAAHSADYMSAVMHQKATLLHDIKEGVNIQVSTVGDALSGHTTHAMAISSTDSNWVGNAAGQALAKSAEKKGLGLIVKQGTQAGVNVMVDRSDRAQYAY